MKNLRKKFIDAIKEVVFRFVPMFYQVFPRTCPHLITFTKGYGTRYCHGCKRLTKFNPK